MSDPLFFLGSRRGQVEAILAMEEAAREVEEELRKWVRSEERLLKRGKSKEGVSVADAANLFVKTAIKALRISVEHERS